MKKTIALLNVVLQIILFSIFTSVVSVLTQEPIIGLVSGFIGSIVVNVLLDEKVK